MRLGWTKRAGSNSTRCEAPSIANSNEEEPAAPHQIIDSSTTPKAKGKQHLAEKRGKKHHQRGRKGTAAPTQFSKLIKPAVIDAINIQAIHLTDHPVDDKEVDESSARRQGDKATRRRLFHDVCISFLIFPMCPCLLLKTSIHVPTSSVFQMFSCVFGGTPAGHRCRSTSRPRNLNTPRHQRKSRAQLRTHDTHEHGTRFRSFVGVSTPTFNLLEGFESPLHSPRHI